MLDLSCARKYDFYLIDLTKNKIKACCKSPFFQKTQTIAEDLEMILSDRAELKQGRQVESCATCWQLEAGQFKSFRTTKTYSGASVLASEDHSPFIIEFLIGNLCNLKCIYCGPDASSKWGPKKSFSVPAVTNEIKILIEEWWPKTEYYNIIGGEPILISASIELIESLKNLAIKKPTKFKKNISIISNLAVPPDIFQRFLNKLLPYCDLFNLEIGVSAESLGEQFEYVRDGASFDNFLKNFETLVQCKRVHIAIVSTLSILTIHNYHRFLKYMIEKLVDQKSSFGFIYNEVVFPNELSPRLFPRPLLSEAKEALNLLRQIPSERIRYKPHFERFCLSLSNLYESLETRSFPVQTSSFLTKSQGDRINKMEWQKCFADLAELQT